jgi:hypothetical protein
MQANPCVTSWDLMKISSQHGQQLWARMQESFKKKGLNSVSYKFFVHPKTAFEMNVPVV